MCILETGEKTCWCRVSTSSRMARASKALSKMVSKGGGSTTTPMAICMRGNGKTISSVAGAR